MNDSLWLPDSDLDDELLAFTRGVRAFAELLPMTHAVHLLQNLWMGQPWSGSLVHVAVMVGTVVVGLAVSSRFFRWE